MDRQAILAKPLRDHFHNTAGIAFVAKPDHEVIRIANKEGRLNHPWLHVLLEPLVQHVVQKHVRNQG
jgi:hypothetical protein